jgi:FKBP-type peptidyl-prolyl cis-trans isomerase
MSRKWVERQNLTNYRNEYDRLMGEMSHLPADLQKEAVHGMIDEYKLKEIDRHKKPEQSTQPEQAKQTEEEETEGLARYRARAKAKAKARAKAKYRYETRTSRTGRTYKVKVGLNE